MRGSDALRKLPKPSAFTLATGLPRFTRFKALKNSTRNCSLQRFGVGEVLEEAHLNVASFQLPAAGTFRNRKRQERTLLIAGLKVLQKRIDRYRQPREGQTARS